MESTKKKHIELSTTTPSFPFLITNTLIINIIKFSTI